MPCYEHEFPRVEDYLHHRPPYLLVRRIVAVEAAEIRTETTLTGEEFFLQGHFPGAPVMPGAMMQELSTQTAGILIAARYNPQREYDTHDPFFNAYALGVLVKVHHARYRGFARPGQTLQVRAVLEERVGDLFDFSATIRVEDRVIMRNGFQLTNIRSAALRGDEAAAG
jgi:3-hydroxyacyl-[acyl-carrier-protein] dehydratase